MKIFGINLSSDSDFKITDGDKLWVEENFRWLKSVFGYPNKREEQVLLTAKFFPATFTSPSFEIDDVITDLCTLFGIARSNVRIELLVDLREVKNIPYQIEGKQFECE